MKGWRKWEVGGEEESEGKAGGAANPETEHVLEDIMTQKASSRKPRAHNQFGRAE